MAVDVERDTQTERRLALLAVFGGLAATHGGRASARERDRDCDEFKTQAAAQHFFVGHGGSRKNNFDDLDEDGDGIACESNPCPCSKAAGRQHRDAEGSPPTVPPGRRLNVRITRDADGDTVYARYGNGVGGYVRLIGIDTPEDVRPDTPTECGAKAAGRSMTAMAAGRIAVLVTDPSQDRFDRYGRLLAYVMVGNVDVGERQVRRGWAMTYVYEHNPYNRYGSYANEQIKARGEGRGVRGSCGGDLHSAEPGTRD